MDSAPQKRLLREKTVLWGLKATEHGKEAQRIALKVGALAVLLAGSHARGQASPYSDVDLLVITESDLMHIEVADVDWTTFDIRYTTIEELEQDMARSFITCNSMLHLRILIGDAKWEQRIETLALQRYPHYVPQPNVLEDTRQQVRVATMRVGLACATGDLVAQAQTGGDVVWLAGSMCLSLAGLGPLREDQWHLGNGLDERLEAALTLAERVVGEPLPVAQFHDLSQPSVPVFQARALPDALEAVEMHRLVKTYGFGKMAKALWMKDKVRQASEAGVIVWFSVRACLALGGLVAPEPFWWHEALSQITLSFDAARFYRHSLLGASFEERKDAACTLGKRTAEALEPLFRNTPFEHKYCRD